MKTTSNFSKLHVPVKIGCRMAVLPNETSLLKADVNYTMVYLKNGIKIHSSTIIGIIEKRLAGNGFFRVNRSTVVNTRQILKRSSTSLEILTTENDKPVHVKISCRRVSPFLEFTNLNN